MTFWYDIWIWQHEKHHERQYITTSRYDISCKTTRFDTTLWHLSKASRLDRINDSRQRHHERQYISTSRKTPLFNIISNTKPPQFKANCGGFYAIKNCPYTNSRPTYRQILGYNNPILRQTPLTGGSLPAVVFLDLDYSICRLCL